MMTRFSKPHCFALIAKPRWGPQWLTLAILVSSLLMALLGNFRWWIRITRICALYTCTQAHCTASGVWAPLPPPCLPGVLSYPNSRPGLWQVPNCPNWIRTSEICESHSQAGLATVISKLKSTPGLSQSHTPFNKNFPATPGVPLPDLVAGLSVAGLALVTILTVCLATVLLVRRWATGVWWWWRSWIVLATVVLVRQCATGADDENERN